MHKLKFIILFLLMGIFINGCSAGNNETNMGKLIIADEIKKVEMSKGSTGEIKSVTLNDAEEISDLMVMVKDITVRQLSKAEDKEFIIPRIEANDMVNIILFSDEQAWVGNFMIWPDGYIYVADIDSMLSDKRTISYLSTSEYPGLYELLDSQIVIPED